MMDALMAYDDRTLDWGSAEIRSRAPPRLRAMALLDRCNGIASEAVRAAPEFRRLVDGAKASLMLIRRQSMPGIPISFIAF